MSAHTPLRRRGLLAGLGAVPLAALAPSSTGARAAAPERPRPQRKALPAAIAKSGADNAVVPPFAVRVLNRMGFGPARRKLGAPQASDPDYIFGGIGGGFETSKDAGQDDVAYFESLGNTDDERLARYVDEQLDPALHDPELAARMAQYPAAFVTLDKSTAYTWSNLECLGFDEYARPWREVEKAAFLRAVYSRRQLFELMVDFWHNHLNIFATLDRPTLVTWQSWDRDVIRNNAFGNFYNMLWASARHPAMLRYLDNYVNRDGGINENYARELFELHTLGAENYRGLVLPSTIEPCTDDQGVPLNPYTALNDAELNDPALGHIANPARQIARYFVDNDVYAAADALTGWRYQNNTNDQPPNCGTGAFLTDSTEHDQGTKAILSLDTNIIPANLQPEVEGRLVVKMAAYHPGTAVYIARKLCRRLIMDDPPESLVQAAADRFYALRKSNRQIAETLKVILLSEEFKSADNWGSKTKRPFEYVVSAMRAAGCNHTWRMDDRTTNDFVNTYNSAGHRLWNWRTPDGYPDHRNHWQGSTTLVQAWRTIDWLVDRNAEDNDRVMRILNITLENISGNPTPRQLVQFWCHWILGFIPDVPGGWGGEPFSQPQTTLGLSCLRFFCQEYVGEAADAPPFSRDLAITRADLSTDNYPNYWHRRLRGLVQLILWSPNFMQR